MKIKEQIPFSMFAKYSNIRLGSYYELPKLNYAYHPFMEFVSVIEAGSRPSGGIQESNCDQAISLGGEQIGADGTLNISKLPYVPTDFYECAKRGKIVDGDILMCKDGALTGKVCQVDISLLPNSNVMANEHIYVIRSNDKIYQKFLFYLMRTELFQNQVKDLAFHKKGQPGLNRDHIRALKIPDVPYEVQKNIIDGAISKVEQKIEQIQPQIRSDIEIIDTVFAKEFNFNYSTLKKLRTQKRYAANMFDFANNPDLRFSVKYHRQSGLYVMRELRRITSKKIKHFLAEPIVLGASISPSDYDDDGEYCYVSMATIRDWRFDRKSANTVSDSFVFDKFTKRVQKGDIIMARSGEGTIGKVALIEDDRTKGIFADFTMRIRLKDYNPQFAYYYFRTTYFQYLIEVYKKGLGNNTNIFPIVVQEFPLIEISLENQQRIVDEICCEIEKQNTLRDSIIEMRNYLDETIENAIS